MGVSEQPEVGRCPSAGAALPGSALSHSPVASPTAAAANAKKCEFPGSAVGCLKCEPCVAIMARRIARAEPHADLIALQSERRCRICDRIERWCQTDGQERGKHAFAPRMSCESCLHMGRQYWGSDDLPIHHCGRSMERRRANFRSCGDLSQDFMDEFRKSYDASPKYSAEDCGLFEPRALPASAIEARSDATRRGAAEGESAIPKGDAK